jgi:hypothetical protein
MANTKKRIFAIPAVAAAIPANPKIAARIATIKNPNAHLNIPPPREILSVPQVITRCVLFSRKVMKAITLPFL